MSEFVQILAAVRVDLARAGCPDYSVLILTDPKYGEGFRDFYLVNKNTDEAVYMFGCFVTSAGEAVSMALYNGPDYIS